MHRRASSERRSDERSVAIASLVPRARESSHTPKVSLRARPYLRSKSIARARSSRHARDTVTIHARLGKRAKRAKRGNGGHQGNRDCFMSHDSLKTPTDACPRRPPRDTIIGRARPFVRRSEGDLETRRRVKDVSVDREPVEREGSGNGGRRRARRSDWIGFHWISFIRSIHRARGEGRISTNFDETGDARGR